MGTIGPIFGVLGWLFSWEGFYGFVFAAADDDDADGGDEEEDADDLEVEVVFGEEGFADEFDVGEFAGGEVLVDGGDVEAVGVAGGEGVGGIEGNGVDLTFAGLEVAEDGSEL